MSSVASGGEIGSGLTQLFRIDSFPLNMARIVSRRETTALHWSEILLPEIMTLGSEVVCSTTYLEKQ